MVKIYNGALFIASLLCLTLSSLNRMTDFNYC